MSTAHQPKVRNLGNAYGRWSSAERLHFNRTGQTPSDVAFEKAVAEFDRLSK